MTKKIQPRGISPVRFSHKTEIFSLKITPYTIQLGCLFASKPHTNNKVRLDNIKNSLLEQNFFFLWCSLTTSICTKMWNKCSPVKEKLSHVSVQQGDLIFTSILFHVPAGCINLILSIKAMVDFVCKWKIIIDTSMDKT